MVKKRKALSKKKRSRSRKKKPVGVTRIKFGWSEPTASERARRLVALRRKRVTCVAEIDLDCDERSQLLATAKELVERAESIRTKSPRVLNTRPLGFRVYMIGNRAVTVHTLSQMV